MRNFKKILCILLAMVTAAVSLLSCSNSLKSTEEELRTVMRVGEQEVPYELYRYLVMSYKSDMPEGTEITPEVEAEIKYNVEEALRDIYAIFAVAREHGISTEDDTVKAAVDAAVKEYQNGFEKTELYVEDLKAQYMNHSVHKLLQSKQVCSDELYYKLMTDGTFETDEKELHDMIYGDGFVRVKQVLIVGESARSSFGDTYFVGGEDHTDEEAKAIAETVLEKARNGEDFDALVSEYGESLFMFKNTDGYYVCEGMWEDVNWNAVKSLEEGEVSEVVSSDSGYSVFLRLEKDEAYLEKNYDTLKSNYYAAQFSMILEKKSEELTVKYTDEFSNISIKDMQ